MALTEWAQAVSHEPLRSFVIFLLLLVGGETTLVPVMGLSVAGWVEPWRVLVLLGAATVVSDVLWYLLGVGADRLPLRRIWGVRWVVRHLDDGVAPVLRQHPAKIVFLSKFVFGARSSVQMLCGMYRVPISRYLLASLAGVMAWGAGVWFLLAVAARWVPVENGVRWFALAVGGVFLLTFALHILVRRVWWRGVLEEKGDASLKKTVYRECA